MVEGVKAGGGVGGPASLPRDGVASTDGQFIVAGGGTSRSVSGTRTTSVAGIGLDTMLALQAVDEAEESDRRARKHGTAMLAALTHLQQTMLAAEDPTAALQSLTELAADGPPPADPALGAILRAVILRTRVELARREVSG
jgi:hypothetical protein